MASAATRGTTPSCVAARAQPSPISVLLTVAVACLWHVLLIGDFRVEYVAENTNRALPTMYLIAALWGGQNGSIMFWGWLLALYTVLILLS